MSNPNDSPYRNVCKSMLNNIICSYIQEYVLPNENPGVIARLGSSLTLNIETGIFVAAYYLCEAKGISRNWTDSRFVDIYDNISRDVLCNIDPRSNINKNLACKGLSGRYVLNKLHFYMKIFYFSMIISNKLDSPIKIKRFIEISRDKIIEPRGLGSQSVISMNPSVNQELIKTIHTRAKISLTDHIKESELHECSNPHCRSKRVIQVSRQNRGLDEAASLFIQCQTCGKETPI